MRHFTPPSMSLPGRQPHNLRALGSVLGEHALVLLSYALLSLALTWPLARDFTTRILSDGGSDPRLNIWILWHAQQAFLGHQPFFDAPLLYYPTGISLWTHSPGPLVGLFALPFWPWGLEAAYNGALIVALVLSGWCMYLLGRSLGFTSGVAWFVGLMFLTAPVVLGGLVINIDKVFLGLFPLLLTLLRALDVRHSAWWAGATAVIVLLTLIHGGWHFLLGALAIAFFVLYAWLTAPAVDRRPLLRRTILLALSIGLVAGPFLLAIVQATRASGFNINRSAWSFWHQPDATEFFLPSQYSRLLGDLTQNLLSSHGVGPNIETAISLAWTGLLLVVIALAWNRRQAAPWLLFTLICMLFALGPDFKWLGQREFTAQHLTVSLPYTWITQLPGLGFMRTPGRFMMMGFVSFAVAAGFGLTALLSRWPRWRYPLLLAATACLLLEAWPRPWPQDTLRPVPDFYRQIAADPEMYGVFDLPHKPRSDASPTQFSSYYQIYQTVHGKGIAAGYVSFTPPFPPLFPCWYSADPTPPDLFVNGVKVSCYTNAQYELARNDFRYVVQHKPQGWYSEFKPGSRGDKIAREFVQAAFPGQTPIVDDDLVTVYQVPAAADALPLTTAIEYRENWEENEEGWRWARSPANLYITSPRQQQATLRITPASIHEAEADDGVGDRGMLTVAMGGQSVRVPIVSDHPVDVPLDLQPGGQTVSLTLEAGNFRPTDYDVPDGRLLSFSIRSINLLTPDAR